MTAYAEVIGDPIAQSKSPLIHNFWLEKIGLSAGYRKTLVSTDELADFLAERAADPRWRGCNVTMPHKTALVPLVARLDPVAAAIGAVNMVVPGPTGLVGYNSDAPGFLEPLAGCPRGRAVVIGTGGAARAIVHALHAAGFALVVVGRDAARADALVESVCGSAAGVETAALSAIADILVAEPVQVLVNATSLGMAGQPPLPVSLAGLDPAAIVYDIVYAPLETPLLAEARQRGHRVIDGLEMLIGQAAVAFARFFGAPAPRQHDAALRALLTA